MVSAAGTRRLGGGPVGATALFLRAGITVDAINATLLGWGGWRLPLLLIGVLMLTGRLPVRRIVEEPVVEPSALPGVQAERPVA